MCVNWYGPATSPQALRNLGELAPGQRVLIRLGVVRWRRADLEWRAAQIERGRLRAVIDRVLPLADIAKAERYLATRRARGKVVIRVA